MQLVLGHLAGSPPGTGTRVSAAPCGSRAGVSPRAASPDDVVVVHGRRTAIARAKRGGFKVWPGGTVLLPGCYGDCLLPARLPHRGLGAPAAPFAEPRSVPDRSPLRHRVPQHCYRCRGDVGPPATAQQRALLCNGIKGTFWWF